MLEGSSCSDPHQPSILSIHFTLSILIHVQVSRCGFNMDSLFTEGVEPTFFLAPEKWRRGVASSFLFQDRWSSFFLRTSWGQCWVNQEREKRQEQRVLARSTKHTTHGTSSTEGSGPPCSLTVRTPPSLQTSITAEKRAPGLVSPPIRSELEQYLPRKAVEKQYEKLILASLQTRWANGMLMRRYDH